MSVSYGVLSTYPPTHCGLASFSGSLVAALHENGDRAGVVQLVESADAVLPGHVVHQWVRDRAAGGQLAADALNQFDVAIVQHEYGIYGGRDGLDVLDAAAALRVPMVLVVHTVLVEPSDRQRLIVQELAALSASVVTMTKAARDRLVAHYGVDIDLIRVVPHGAHAGGQPGARPQGAEERAPWGAPTSDAQRRPVVLTWGLLGDGKGIEWAVEAMAQLRDLSPAYRVVGQTHPKVVAHEGERYRERLVERAQRFGVSDLVEFDDRYLDADSLRAVVAAADVVLLPYDSQEQVTSGVLVEALAAGKPVVSTGFPHAVEALGSGAGLLVNRKDPTGIADGLRRVLTEPTLATSMAAQARRIAPQMLWPAVAQQYRELAALALSSTLVAAATA
jgi:glycosyltransferase involved in cell wall biosynthesis